LNLGSQYYPEGSNSAGPSPSQIERFIAYVDKDRDNKMSAHELAEYFIEVDEKSREVVLDKYWAKQVEQVYEKLGKAENELLSWEEIEGIMLDSEVTHVIENLRKRYDYADADKDGMLNKAEVLVLMVPELSDRRAEYFKSFEFRQMDTDSDGLISWEDYWHPNNDEFQGGGEGPNNSITSEDIKHVEEKERRLWANCDRDGDGRLSPEEYFVFATVQWSFHEVSYALNADTNDDQHITKAEILANLDVFTPTLTYHDEL